MNEYIVPHQGHGPPRNGPSLLQQVRGKYLAVHYDVEGLLSRYVKLLEELNVATEQMKTCKLQSRMLYEGHSAIHQLLRKMYLDFSETRASEIRFAGALELSWNAIQPVHEVISEYASLDEMESWFQHSQIDEQLSEMWGLLDSTFVALRDEVKYDIEPFVALNESLTRVLVVPGQTEVAWRQVHRADQLEQPKLFQNLVKDLDSTTSLLFMKPMYIEEFMEAMQKDMNQYPAKSQTYKMYDERLQQIYDRSQVLPPVNEFDTNDIRRTSADPTNESPPGSVFRGKTTSGDVVSIKMLTAFASTEKARETLYGEVQKWNRLRHPNLQRILGIWYPYSSRDGVFSLVSKGIKRGDILTYIRENPKFDRVQALQEIALGIQYLHSKDVPHGDIRGINVLMKENGEPCVTNFGLMHALEIGCDVHTAMALLELGSVRWMAPEIYDAELIGKDRGSPTKEADCHSFSMLILELITGQKPFAYIQQDPVVVIELVRGGRPIRPIAEHNARQDPTFQVIDDSLWQLCEACWVFPPEKRLTMPEIVDAMRTYQRTTRLEESRSRAGGHLLTLPGAMEIHAIEAGLAAPPFLPLTEKALTEKALTEKAYTGVPSTPSEPAMEFIAQSAPPSVAARSYRSGSRASTRAPVVSHVSPPASSRRSGVPGPTGASEAPDSDGEPLEGLSAARQMIAAAQNAIDFEQRVLDEEQLRLNDISEALLEAEEDQGDHVDYDEEDDHESVILHEVSNATDSIPDNRSVKQHTPPTQDFPVVPPYSLRAKSPNPNPRRSHDHRIQTIYTGSTPSFDSLKLAQGAAHPAPQSIHITSQSGGKTPRASILAASTVSSPITVHPPNRHSKASSSKRRQSSSQQSLSHATSKASIRSPKHPDLARSSSRVPLLDASSSVMDLMNPLIPPGTNRLSTIPDDEDEVAAASPEKHAEDDDAWYDLQQQKAGSDWEFLRLVEENRRKRKADKAGAPRSRMGDNEDFIDLNSDAHSAFADPPHQFPPPINIIPTPASFAKSKSLPPIPPPSNGGDGWWDDQEEFDEEGDDDDATIPMNPNYDPRTEAMRNARKQRAAAGSVDNSLHQAARASGLGHKKRSSGSSIVTAIHVSQLQPQPRSPRMHPLPASTAGKRTRSSGATSKTKSIPPIQQFSKPSSGLSVRGSTPIMADVYRDGDSMVGGSEFGGHKTSSTLSTNTHAVLTGIGEAVCPTCGRMFSTKSNLDNHIIKQGGRCRQRSLNQDLTYVGEFDDV